MQRIVTLVHKLEDERNNKKKNKNNNGNNNFAVCANNTKYVDLISLPSLFCIFPAVVYPSRFGLAALYGHMNSLHAVSSVHSKVLNAFKSNANLKPLPCWELVGI